MEQPETMKLFPEPWQDMLFAPMDGSKVLLIKKDDWSPETRCDYPDDIIVVGFWYADAWRVTWGQDEFADPDGWAPLPRSPFVHKGYEGGANGAG